MRMVLLSESITIVQINEKCNYFFTPGFKLKLNEIKLKVATLLMVDGGESFGVVNF